MSETATRPQRLPGILVCLLVALAGLVMNTLWGVSALLMAIVLGVLWRNVAPVPAVLEAGTAFSARTLLRWGIVVLGLQLALGDIAALGWGVILTVCAAVGLCFGFTVVLGRWLKVDTPLTLLVASGFSICGASAVAGAQSVVQARRDQVATAVGLVVLFGTLMIPLMPALTSLFGWGAEEAGVWIGASTHEVAQVVAAGEAVGPDAVGVAVTVKLARVLLLAPVLAGLAWWARREAVLSDTDGERVKPPLVPWFVAGFFGLVILRSTGWLPEQVLDGAQIVQTLLLSMAMFGLGLGVHLRSLARVGPRPVVLGAASTVFIILVGGVGAALTAG